MGMRRWAEILTTLVLFAIVMTAIGWGLSAVVPRGVDWLADRIGDIAFLAIIATVIALSGAYAWRAHRPKAGSAAGKYGRARSD